MLDIVRCMKHTLCTCNALDLGVVWETVCSNRVWDNGYPNRLFSSLHHFLQANVSIMPLNMPRPFPYKYL